eukprot:9478557-Pyramimonas_sp.AAC.1
MIGRGKPTAEPSMSDLLPPPCVPLLGLPVSSATLVGHALTVKVPPRLATVLNGITHGVLTSKI